MTSEHITHQEIGTGRRSIAVFLAGIALIIVGFALYAIAAPHGLLIGPRNLSLAERLSPTLIVAAFACCVTAPFFSRRRLEEKLFLSHLAGVGAVVATVGGFFVMMVLYGSCL